MEVICTAIAKSVSVYGVIRVNLCQATTCNDAYNANLQAMNIFIAQGILLNPLGTRNHQSTMTIDR